jgi:hypothetical protein
MNARMVLAGNGASPVSVLNMMAAMAKTSVVGPTELTGPSICSGAMKPGVPKSADDRVMASRESRSLHMPRSSRRRRHPHVRRERGREAERTGVPAPVHTKRAEDHDRRDEEVARDRSGHLDPQHDRQAAHAGEDAGHV